MTASTLDFGHIEAVPVFFDDFDPMGVVHNARYALLLERALTNFWAARGHAFEAGRPLTPDAFNVVREYSITYHVPIRDTGDVAVHFWLEHLGASSGVYAFRVMSPDAGTVYADGRRVVVKLDPATLRPSPWSDDAITIATTLLHPLLPRPSLPRPSLPRS